jgi:hypothetical protein
MCTEKLFDLIVVTLNAFIYTENQAELTAVMLRYVMLMLSLVKRT